MKLDEGMDTGPTFARIVTPIGPDETAGEVGERLAQLGAGAVSAWLPKFVEGECPVESQDDEHATVAPMLTKEHGRIDWAQTATAVHNHVRGMSPWPGAFTTSRARLVKVHSTRVVDGEGPAAAPGQVIVADKSRVLVACGRGIVELVKVQPEGRRVVLASEVVHGPRSRRGRSPRRRVTPARTD